MNIFKSLFQIIIACTFSINCSYAQKVISITGTVNGSSTINYEARDEINFTNAALYTPTGTNSLTAVINEQKIEVVDVVANPSVVLNRTQLNTTLKVGTTGGEASVSNSGQAMYTIPLFTSPGTNSLEPQLAIQYVSQQEPGVLGYGWDISGLSTIIRVNQNQYYDGVTEGITFTNSDGFSFDGQRLIVTSGTNGSNGAVYATEQESFLMITSNGVAGSGPQWFKVKNKDGVEIEIGNTADSRLTNASGTAFIWKVNKITDAYGNYITFTYLNEGGEMVIKKVDYTGNVGQSLAPYNSVEFFYERKDAMVKYISGKELKSSLLLNRIAVKAEGDKAREYKFNYQKDTYVKLMEIIETGGSESYNSTLIKWSDEVTSPNITTLYSNLPVVARGDYNGDGKTDYIQYNYTLPANQFTLWIADGVGFSPYTIPYSRPASPNVFPQISSVDFDTDSKDEIYIRAYSGVTSLFYAFQFTGSAVTGYTNTITATAFSNPFVNGSSYDRHGISLIQVDFNNDGVNEVVGLRTMDGTDKVQFVQQVFTSGSTNYYTLLPAVVKTYNAANITKIDFIDFDANGKTDLFFNDNTGATVYKFTAATFQQFFTPVSNVLNTYVEHFWGDFNGDGNADLLVHKNVSVNPWYLYMSDGKVFLPVVSVGVLNTYIPGGMALKGLLNVNDYTADGKADLMVLSANSNISLFKNLGTGLFSSAEVYSGVNNITTFDNCFFADFNTDGRCDIYTPQYNLIKVKGGDYSNYVQSVSNGLNLTSNFMYDVSTSGSLNYIAYPIIYAGSTQYGVVKYPLVFVKSMYTDYPGLNPYYLNKVDYSFTDGVYHRDKGFLGFRRITKENRYNYNLISTTDEWFNLDYTYFYLYPSATYAYGNSIASQTTNYTFYPLTTYGSTKRYWLKLKTQVETDHILGVTNTTSYESASGMNNGYDNYGNILNVVKSNASGSEYTVNTYVQAGTFAYSPNKLSTQTITYKKSGETDITRSTQYLSYNTAGMPTQVVAFSGMAKSVTTTVSYNGFGSVIAKSVAAAGLSTSAESFVYDTKSRFAIEERNPLNQKTENTFDTRSGNNLSKKSVDGNITTNTYDGFGNLVSSTDPLGLVSGFVTEWDYSYNSIYRISVHRDGLPDAETWYDQQARKVKESSIGQGMATFVDYTYDSRGRLSQKTYPYNQTGTASRVFNYSYNNDISRLKQVDDNGKVTKYDYTGKTTKLTDVSTGRVYETTVDDNGRTILAKDPAGSQVSYAYYSDGQLKSTTAVGLVTTIEYDAYGRQTKLTDPNAGTSTFTYNAYGQLVAQTDGNGITFNSTYDVLGRITSKQEPVTGKHTDYTYVTSGNGINQVATITSPDNVSQSYEYDSYGRVIKSTEVIGGQSFQTTNTYNSLGKPATITYPSGYSVKYLYDANGYLSELRNNANNAMIWKGSAFNEQSQLSQAEIGNGLTLSYSYNANNQPTYITLLDYPNRQLKPPVYQMSFIFDPVTKNLSSRKDDLKNITESFTYDNLDRLKTCSLNNVLTVNMVYESGGNIQKKSDVSAGNWTYMVSKPHALQTVPAPLTSVPSFSQDIAYNSYTNRVQTITENNKALAFTYGVDNERRKTVLQNNGLTVKTKYFIGNYEKEETPSGTKEFHYIYSPFGLAAVVVKQNGTETTYYAFTDYQGSIRALVDQNQQIVEEYDYDPWGRRRNPATWTASGSVIPSITSRGYTEHEHLDDFTLINMNARLYDPVIGRMLSPDNFVQDGTSTQNYNRYSYALNNPLVYSDPDGNLIFLPIIIMLGAALGTMQGLEAGVSRGAKGWGLAGYALAGAAIGTASSYVGTSVGALGFVGAGALGGAIHGGGMNLLYGQNVAQGFFTGAISGGLGSAVGAGIGGGLGSLFGGATSAGVNTALNGGNINEILLSAAKGGTLSLGMYHITSLYNWGLNGGNKMGDVNITYRQYNAMQADMQRSMYWKKEYGGVLRANGSVFRYPKSSLKYNGVDLNGVDLPDDVIAHYHTHWQRPGVSFVTLPDGMSALPPGYSGSAIDQTSMQYHSPPDLTYTGRSIVINRYDASYSSGDGSFTVLKTRMLRQSNLGYFYR